MTPTHGWNSKTAAEGAPARSAQGDPPPQPAETVADIFAEIVQEAIGSRDGIPSALKAIVKPYIGKATEAMASDPEKTRELLLIWVPRLIRAAEIDPETLRVIIDAEDAVAARPRLD